MTILSWTNAFPGIPMPQHKSGQSVVQTYVFPGGVMVNSRVGTVLASAAAFPGIPFAQHGPGLATIRTFTYPGGLQPPVEQLPPTVVDVSVGDIMLVPRHRQRWY